MKYAYRPDHAGMASWILSESGIRKHLESVAAEAKRYAESISPRDTGEYASSWHTESEVSYAGTRTRRPVVRLVNDAPHAWAVEGSHHVLSRTRDEIEAK